MPWEKISIHYYILTIDTVDLSLSSLYWCYSWSTYSSTNDIDRSMLLLQLDSNPEIGAVSRTPLQALVLPEDSTAVSRVPSPKEAKGNADSRERIRDSSSDAIDVKCVHILHVHHKY